MGIHRQIDNWYLNIIHHDVHIPSRATSLLQLKQCSDIKLMRFVIYEIL